ncbi:MAG: branched-chain amino acid ABC transporter permease [Rhodospirillaceae bacterium]|jgi:branched-chain amino acid transport system permease protein|nr:branched-chain amino acid ABC transporter permease [Rhodospirillaceae bacterium]|tara:strand:+ start:946 stop:1965 length:1020 start_codon:yes stop_codon:yes gene_type:complete
MTILQFITSTPKRFVYALIGTIIATPLLVALPHALTSYWQSVLVIFALNTIMVMGYRVITTMGGWSFSHVATAGLGAYTTAILMTLETPWSFWATLFLGAGISGLFALIIAYPVLRTRHYYFFLSTFAAGEALRQAYIQFKGITGGSFGISFIPRPEGFWGIDFNTTTGFYYLVLAIALIIWLLLYRFDLSRVGRTIKAVAANEELSESIGINTWGHRTLPFVLGSVIAGFAGALSANFNGAINPLDFGSILMFKLVAAAIVGGVSTFFGPILGLLYLTALEEIFRAFAEWVPLLWGASVIAVLMIWSGGLEMAVLKLLALLRPILFNRAKNSSAKNIG